MIRFKNFRIKPWSQMTEADKTELLAWIVNLCRSFGTSWYTALVVAAEFAKGLERDG